MKTLMLFLSLIITANASADFSKSQNTKCKIFTTPSQSKLKPNWHGPCKNGFANGLGVIRNLKGSNVDSIFYGVLENGLWASGVYETQGGYRAGQFKNNELVSAQEVDRNVIIRAFDTAAKAATQLSKEFEQQGNMASYKHYKAEAEKLSQQMD
jgi:hypothetical protein